MEQIVEGKNSEIKKIGIIGDGHYPESISYILSKVSQNVEIVIWTHKEEYAKKAESSGKFRHSKKKKKKLWFRQKMELPENVRITNDPQEVVQDSVVLFSLLTAQKTRMVIEKYFKQPIKENWKNQRALISGTKGLEKGSNKRMSEVWQETFEPEGIDISEKFGVLAGLTFAKDILYDEWMVANIVSKSEDVRIIGTDALLHKDFSVLPSEDVCGAETIGASKNVIAIAAGAARAKGYSDSTFQGLMSAANSEVKRFGLSLGADKESFSSELPMMRDLEGTATSKQSRNWQEGYSLVKREKRDRETGVAEGVETVEAVIALAKEKKIKMPVCEAVYKMVKKEKPSVEIAEDLNQYLNNQAKRIADIARRRVENGNEKGEK
jgi:glycerol-3-phosphate dehydrogenase (NAD(P)+)